VSVNSQSIQRGSEETYGVPRIGRASNTDGTRVSPLGWWSFGPGADAPGALPGVSLLISGWAIA